MTILENIDKHIEKCEKSLSDGTVERTFREIMGIYENKISGGTKGFIAYSIAAYASGTYDYNSDIMLLIEKLELYKSELQEQEQRSQKELEKLRLQAEISKASIQVTATGGNASSNSTSNVTSTVSITIEQTISAINEMPQASLSDEDKEKLQNDLYALEGIKSTKNKSKFWAKAKEVMKFIADKGADATIAAMPYIIQALQQM